MDMKDIRKLETVVDRLKAQGPSGVAAPHCWFCGKIEAWFRCDCKDAIEAQQGKRNKPRWVEKDGKGYIVLDPDVIAREHNQRRKRYEPPDISHAESESVDSVDTETLQIVDSVDNSPVHAVVEDAKAARRAYKAEHERRRRARQKGEQP